MGAELVALILTGVISTLDLFVNLVGFHNRNNNF